MTTFRKVRELLLTSFDDGDISEDEFLLLYDVNRSKNPDFPYQNYELFDLERLDEKMSDLNLMPKQVYGIIIVNKHINKHKKKLVKLTGLLSLSSSPSPWRLTSQTV